MFQLFTMPDATSTMANIGTWSSVSFDSYLPLAYLGCGFLIGGILIAFLINSVVGAVSRIVNKDND